MAEFCAPEIEFIARKASNEGSAESAAIESRRITKLRMKSETPENTGEIKGIGKSFFLSSERIALSFSLRTSKSVSSGTGFAFETEEYKSENFRMPERNLEA